jgi:hypothetical protein
MDASDHEKLKRISPKKQQSMIQQSRTLCFLAIFLTKEMTSKLAAESKPLVGSSRNRSFGLVISWLATLIRRFCPPLRPLRIGVPISVSACP